MDGSDSIDQGDLTWGTVLLILSRQFGEDIAQDVMVNYCKKNKQIQHGLRYFRVCAKNARLMRSRRSAFRQVDKHEEIIAAIPTRAQQLTRCLLQEVWDTLTTEQQERALDHAMVGPRAPVTTQTKTSTARVRMYRLRKKLQLQATT